MELYVNGKSANLNKYLYVSGLNVEKLLDILIVEVVSYSECFVFAVDSDANVINLFNYDRIDALKEIDIIKTKGDYRSNGIKILDNYLYIQTDLLAQDDRWVVCNSDKNKGVVFVEKIKYLGNGNFGEPEIESEITAGQYIINNNINNCPDSN